MTYTTREGGDEGWRTFHITPNEPHAWLRDICVNDRGVDNIVVDFYPKKDISESEFTAIVDKLSAIQTPKHADKYTIGFKHEQSEKTQALLIASGIPEDIQAGVVARIAHLHKLEEEATKKGFYKDDLHCTGNPCIVFTPKVPHVVFSAIDVEDRPGHPLELVFHIHRKWSPTTSAASHEPDKDRASYKRITESLHQSGPVQEAIGRRIKFELSPTCNTQTILAKAELPEALKVAVIDQIRECQTHMRRG